MFNFLVMVNGFCAFIMLLLMMRLWWDFWKLFDIDLETVREIESLEKLELVSAT
jgi:hypothetical protein